MRERWEIRLQSENLFSYGLLVCVEMVDPLHIASKQAGEDSTRKVLHPSRGIRETQG